MSSPISCRSPGAQARTAMPRTLARASASSFCSAARTVELARCSCATRQVTGRPGVADLDERGLEHLDERLLERRQGERLVDEAGECDDVARRGGCDDRRAQLRGRHRNCLAAPEKRRRLADPVALFDARLQPLDARDVDLGIAALTPRRPLRAKNAVALLPLADRVGWHAGALRQRGDVQASESRQLLDESLPERVTVGKRARGRHPPPGGKPAPGARR